MSTEKPLYLNFDEALNLKRNIKNLKIIIAVLIVKILQIFFQRNTKFTQFVYIQAETLRIFKNVYSTKNYSSNYITDLIDKIDPKKQMKI